MTREEYADLERKFEEAMSQPIRKQNPSPSPW